MLGTFEPSLGVSSFYIIDELQDYAPGDEVVEVSVLTTQLFNFRKSIIEPRGKALKLPKTLA